MEISQLGIVQTQQIKDGDMDIAQRMHNLNRLLADFVGGANYVSSLRDRRRQTTSSSPADCGRVPTWSTASNAVVR